MMGSTCSVLKRSIAFLAVLSLTACAANTLSDMERAEARAKMDQWVQCVERQQVQEQIAKVTGRTGALPNCSELD